METGVLISCKNMFGMQRNIIIPLIGLFHINFSQLEAIADMQQEFKSNVIDNCEAAKSEIYRFQITERNQIINYLTKVAYLKSSVVLGPDLSSMHSNTINQQKQGISVFERDEMLRTLDPQKELNARICALKLLELLLPESIISLPKLLDVFDDDTLVFEESQFYLLLQDTIRELIVRTAKMKPEFFTEEYLKLLLATYIETENPYKKLYIERAFTELQIKGINFLLTALHENSASSGKITALLYAIDTQGEVIVDKLLKLAGDLDENIRKAAINTINKINLPDKTATLTVLLERLFDPIETIRLVALDGIYNLIINSKEILLSEIQIKKLIDARRYLIIEHREKVDQILLGVSDGYEALIFNALISDLRQNLNSETYNSTLLLLSKLKSHEEELFSLIVKYCLGKNPAERSVGYRALANQAIAPKEKIIDILFKNLAEIKDCQEAECILERYQTTLDVLENLRLGESFKRAIPLLLDVYSADSKTKNSKIKAQVLANSGLIIRIENAIAMMGESSIPELLKAIKSKNSLLRLRALTILNRVKPVTDTVINVLIKLLNDKDPAIQAAAFDGLTQIYPKAKSSLMKLSKSNNEKLKGYATYILLKNKEDVKINDFFKNFYLQLNCEKKQALFEDSVLEVKTKTAKDFLTCLNKADANLVNLLLKKILENPEKFNCCQTDFQKELINVLPLSSREIKYTFFKEYTAYKLPLDYVLAELKTALNSLDFDQITASLKTAMFLNTVANNLLPEIEKVIVNVDLPVTIRGLAVITKAKILNDYQGIAEFYQNQVQTNDFKFVFDQLTELDKGLANQIIENWLKRGEDQQILSLLELCVGKSAFNICPISDALLSNRDDKIRLKSLFIVLKSGYLEESTKFLISRELFGINAGEFVNATFSAVVIDYINTLFNTSESQVIRNFSKQILSKSRSISDM